MYYIQFNELNENTIVEKLAVKISDVEKEAMIIFKKITNHYSANEGGMEAVIDLCYANGEILRDYPLTYVDAKNLASSMGFKL